MNKEKLNIVIAGGGTGGHLFPGIAIAQQFMAENPESRVLFIGTDRAFEKNALEKAGFPHKAIPSAGLKGMGLFKKLGALIKIPAGMIASLFMLQRFKPHMVIGVGGYSSGPVLLSAYFMRIRTAIHEQNTVPGITNRLLAYFASRLYVSFASTGKALMPAKALTTGNPVRKEILHGDTPKKDGPLSVLILGGSQGAHSINMAMVDALGELENLGALKVIHQTGERDEERVRHAYQGKKINSKVQAFISHMGDAYREADLIFCRAGATTIAEITALGKAAVFIPYPHAADNHQYHNARALTETGAGEMITEEALSGKAIAEKIAFYQANPDLLREMGAAAKKHGNPCAAELIVSDCYQTINRKAKRT